MNPNNSIAYIYICGGCIGLFLNLVLSNEPNIFGFAVISGIGAILFGLYLIGNRFYNTKKYRDAVNATVNSHKYDHSVSIIEIHHSFLKYTDTERSYKLNLDILQGYSMKGGYLFIRHSVSLFDAIALHESTIGRDDMMLLMNFLDEKKVRYIEI